MADTPVTGVSDGVARVVTCAIVLTTVVEVVIDTLVKGVGEGAVAVVLKRAVIVAAVDTPVMSVGEGTADVRSLAVAVAAVLPVEIIQRSTFIGASTKKEHV